LPPDFTPMKVSLARANTALAAIQADGTAAAESHRRAIGNYVFWTLAEMCEAFKLPFDLMIGVNRGVYEAGVHQGRDLYDSRVSLIQYKELFNAFPRVTFPISVLASVTNQELTSYAWIFPNVVTNGHWWYSNTPAFIEHDLAARLEAVPWTKQIGYYSDMYKLEFGLPKFAMFKRILAKVLAERFVIDRGWSETQAIELGKQVLRGNVESIFRWSDDLREELPSEDSLEPPLSSTSHLGPITAIAAESSTPVPGEEWNKPELRLRRPDEQRVIPVPAENEEDAFDLAGIPTSSKAAAEEPPPLEIIADTGELELEEVSTNATDAGGEDNLTALYEQLTAEKAAAEEVTNDDAQSLRQTEPFPIQPPKNDLDDLDFRKK
jgi:hypothetical protein